MKKKEVLRAQRDKVYHEKGLSYLDEGELKNHIEELLLPFGVEYTHNKNRWFFKSYCSRTVKREAYVGGSSNSLDTINFYRHTRNAVSHAKCFYEVTNNVCYVTFKDENPKDVSQYCQFTIKTADMGLILEKLQIQIMMFLNSQWTKR